ncbi:hypothetical protein LCGC14_1050810 [marine sediment metagenome]|uniref:Sec-independent protein translocase protein TatA n=1 Tax=marine sediment metagenome TaxID=412755 RepID=A0A0F9MTB5_9ZZZZ
MFGIGPQEIFIIFIIALVIFGPKRLPEVAKTLAKGVNSFKKAANSITEEVKSAVDLDDISEEADRKKN